VRYLMTLSLALTLLCIGAPFAAPVQAQDPTQEIGRYLGFGWGDGYHSKRTWSLYTPPFCNCQSGATRQAAPAAMPQTAPKNAEPISPSDRPVQKTSLRRYPTATKQTR
jgi:hypothetical protein